MCNKPAIHRIYSRYRPPLGSKRIIIISSQNGRQLLRLATFLMLILHLYDGHIEWNKILRFLLSLNITKMKLSKVIIFWDKEKLMYFPPHQKRQFPPGLCLIKCIYVHWCFSSSVIKNIQSVLNTRTDLLIAFDWHIWLTCPSPTPALGDAAYCACAHVRPAVKTRMCKEIKDHVWRSRRLFTNQHVCQTTHTF